MSFPGGCELGPRPIDMHIAAMKKLGAKVVDEYGIIKCTAERGLHGARINLNYPSVGTTENIMLAAVTAKGQTVISNAAREPEIIDLADFLNRCGGRIKGAGNSTIVIDGVQKLRGCTYSVIADRIAAATYISAAASTGGEISLTGIDSSICDSFLPVFEQMGCKIYVYSDRLYINASGKLKGVNKITTMPHPGFPTDAQAVIMAALCKAYGSSMTSSGLTGWHIGYLMSCISSRRRCWRISENLCCCERQHRSTKKSCLCMPEVWIRQDLSTRQNR